MFNFVKTIYWEISFMNYFNLLLMELLWSQKKYIGIRLMLNFAQKKDLILFFVGILFFQGPSIYFCFFFHPSILYWFETEFYNLFQFAFYMVIVVLKKHSVIWLMLKFTKKEINFIICKFSLFLRPFIFFSYLILCWLRIEFL